ncbi:hypothetical protein G7046_g2094 [Stylonectria norvegica]|nr:hypothetical protein G7046_g2094 [Stylonectria norvegica]
MAPPKKRAKPSRASPNDESTAPSLLLSDHRTAWLVKSEDHSVELKAKGETFSVSKLVLTKNSEYFESCLNGQFQEAAKGVVQFDDDVDPRYLALYIGLAYSHSTIVPHTPPAPAANPEASAPKTRLRDYIEVYKLCDRFISTTMASFVSQCINTAIVDGHRALFRASSDDGIQKVHMRDFADGYEALEQGHEGQKDIALKLIAYFCEGIHYRAWINFMVEVADCPCFVAHVSRGFAMKLAELTQLRKLKRKELK